MENSMKTSTRLALVLLLFALALWSVAKVKAGGDERMHVDAAAFAAATAVEPLPIVLRVGHDLRPLLDASCAVEADLREFAERIPAIPVHVDEFVIARIDPIAAQSL
jgi:hypothetical protein